MGAEVYKKLLEVQSELKVPKNLYNMFGKYYYRNAESILEAVKPLLKKVGAALVVTDTIEAIGNRIYVKATAVFTDTESMEQITCSASAREEENKKGMDASQITGAASSYARKYALNGLFCLDDNKDADALPQENTKEKSENGKNPEKVSNAELICELFLELDRAGFTMEAVFRKYNVKRVEELTVEQLKHNITELKKLPDKKNKGGAR